MNINYKEKSENEKIYRIAFALLMVLSLCACGKQRINISQNSKSKKATDIEKLFDEEIVIADNDDVRFVITGKYEHDGYSVETGYLFEFENKTNTRYYSICFEDTSVDGYMTFINYNGAHCAPQKKIKGKMDVRVDSIDDLKDVEGTLALYQNSDGGSEHMLQYEFKFKID